MDDKKESPEDSDMKNGTFQESKQSIVRQMARNPPANRLLR
jgi:hypothetical protein